MSFISESSSWGEATKRAVWDKAQKDTDENEQNGFRKDQCGAWICWQAYGDRSNEYGWEIDHITPQSKGGGDELSNLRPLHWKNNASRQDGRLSCVVRSEGAKNIDSTTTS
ncbi:HNH endonuclease signature motif containing protein [Laribacter hongkongensis]|uniref:HNH endonuclease signature motif containing protein n=1 Tax=Laribacter hongkongensis TaxID=168471 RepID=UPI0028360654|nr:HNH endonuclease [Laribacter hongkongensis]